MISSYGTVSVLIRITCAILVLFLFIFQTGIDRDKAKVSLTVFTFPESALATDGFFEVNISTREPFEARSLQIHPSSNQFMATCELLPG